MPLERNGSFLGIFIFIHFWFHAIIFSLGFSNDPTLIYCPYHICFCLSLQLFINSFLILMFYLMHWVLYTFTKLFRCSSW